MTVVQHITATNCATPLPPLALIVTYPSIHLYVTVVYPTYLPFFPGIQPLKISALSKSIPSLGHSLSESTVSEMSNFLITPLKSLRKRNVGKSYYTRCNITAQ